MSKTMIEKLLAVNHPLPEMRFEGSSFEAGKYMARWTLENYPFYPWYLGEAVQNWSAPPECTLNLYKKYAPWVLEFYRGMLGELHELHFDPDVPPPPLPEQKIPGENECTSFSLAPELCVGNAPLSGQTKDTGIISMDLYIVLNMHLTDGPSMLKLAYPGELCGYGMHDNGMTLFRNNLKSTAEGSGIPGLIFALLSLCTGSVQTAGKIALEYGVGGMGNYLLSDLEDACSFETNAGGVEIIPRRDGIQVHTNHPLGASTLPYEYTKDAPRPANSRFREELMNKALRRLDRPVTPEMLFAAMASHNEDPKKESVCRHGNEEGTAPCTTAAVVADPVNRKLYVTRGLPCMGKPTVYTML